MRINIYSQEIDLIRIPEIVVKEGVDDKGQPAEFMGIRFFLISPDAIHQSKTDDDQSAVTFWLPKSPGNRTNIQEHFHYAAWLVGDNLK